MHNHENLTPSTPSDPIVRILPAAPILHYFATVTKSRMASLFLILLLPAATLGSGGPPACDGELLFMENKSCADVSHGPLYEEDRTEDCGVEDYRTCEINRAVQSDELPCGNPSPELLQAALDSAARNFLWQYENEFPGLSADEKIPRIVALLRNAPRTVDGRGQGADCRMTFSFKPLIKRADESCGVESYKLCRSASHARLGWITKNSPACGLNRQTIYILSPDVVEKNADRLRDGGQLFCSTGENEISPSERSRVAKLDVLRSNLARLSPATPEILLNGDGPRGLSDRGLRSAQISILLEIARLQMLAPTGDVSIDETKQQLQDVIGGRLEDAFNLLVEGKRDLALVTLMKLFPEARSSLSKNSIENYATMEPAKFVALYPNGLAMSEAGLRAALEQIGATNDPRAIYRMAEAAARGGLEQIRDLQRRALLLMDLRVRSARGVWTAAATAIELAKISGERGDRVAAELSSFEKDPQALQIATANILDAKVRVLNERAEAVKKVLWPVLEAAKRSTDPRVPLLGAYRALNEFNAPLYAESLREVSLNVRTSEAAAEVSLSLSLVDKAAKATAKTLSSVNELIEKNAAQEPTHRKSVIALLVDASPESDAFDHIAKLIAPRLFAFRGGPGAEFALEEELLALLR